MCGQVVCRYPSEASVWRRVKAQGVTLQLVVSSTAAKCLEVESRDHVFLDRGQPRRSNDGVEVELERI